MPTYEYACTECGERLEVVQSFSDDPLTICPSCQGKLRKLFSPVGVVFKGSGFYKTDSRSSKKPAASPAGADAANGSDAAKGSDATESAAPAAKGAGSGAATPAATKAAESSSSSSGTDSSGSGSKVA